MCPCQESNLGRSRTGGVLDHRAAGALRVEPVGIEPTTSWVQTRRSPELSYGPVCARRESNPDLRLVVPVLDRSSSTRMCRPLESNQDVPLFRRPPGPPRPGRRTPLRSVRGSNPSRWRDKPLASPEAQRTRDCVGDWRESNSRRATTLAGSQPADGPFVVSRHEAGEVGAEGIEPPSRGNRPRALPLDDAPVVSQGGRD
jgi:hypothetical protein